ncbi:MAG: lasso peptide biosynthesis B2 protein, partial [Actinomycetota bacterium]|nr:lasso peptide biosynthesis B2 protein [Actinomycetota bacterium]
MTRRSAWAGRLCVPDYLHLVNGPGGAMTVLNPMSGQWHALNVTAGALWRELGRTGDLDIAISALEVGYPESVRQVFRADARLLALDLRRRGLVVRGEVAAGERMPADRDLGTPTRALDGVDADFGWRTALLAHFGLLIAVCLLRLPFRWTLRLVDVVLHRWCARRSTAAEASVTMAAVTAAANRYPGRAACLERSLGAVVTAAITRRRLTWVLGAAEDPCRFHAWVEVG